MGPNVMQDWLQIVAGIFAIFGLFFLATGITDEAQDRKIIAPLLGGIGLALYAILFDFAFGWPAPGPVALGIVGFAAGYALSAWLLLRRMPRYQGNTSLSDASIRSLLLVVVFGVLFGGQRLLTSHSLTEAGIAATAIIVGGTILLLCFLAVLRARAAWLRVLGVALTFGSITLLLISPVADLLGTPIK